MRASTFRAACLALTAATLAAPAALAQNRDKATSPELQPQFPAVGQPPAPGAGKAGSGATVIVANPGNAYMRPTGSTPPAAKSPPNSQPGNLTPGR